MNIRLHIFLAIIYQGLAFLLSFYIGAKITLAFVSFLPGDLSDWDGLTPMPVT